MKLCTKDMPASNGCRERNAVVDVGENIGNLQCYSFHLQGNSLMREEIVPLVESRQNNW